MKSGTTYSTVLRLKHKNTRASVQKGGCLVKISKKSCQKLLTNPKGSDNICKHSTRDTSERAKKEILKRKQKVFEKNLKNFQKSIDKEISNVIYSLSCLERAANNWTLKIKQRDKKRNPRFDGK